MLLLCTVSIMVLGLWLPSFLPLSLTRVPKNQPVFPQTASTLKQCPPLSAYRPHLEAHRVQPLVQRNVSLNLSSENNTQLCHRSNLCTNVVLNVHNDVST